MPPQHRDLLGRPVKHLQFRTACAEICTARAEGLLVLELPGLPQSQVHQATLEQNHLIQHQKFSFYLKSLQGCWSCIIHRLFK